MDVRPTEKAIYLTKRAKVVLDEGRGVCSTSAVATFNKNLESLGFTLSRALFERLRTHSVEEVARLYEEIVPVLERMVGAHRQFRPCTRTSPPRSWRRAIWSFTSTPWRTTGAASWPT